MAPYTRWLRIVGILAVLQGAVFAADNLCADLGSGCLATQSASLPTGSAGSSSPESVTATLTNNGTTNTPFSVNINPQAQSWLSAQPSGGNINGGGATVDITISGNAQNLNPGTYHATVTIQGTNTSAIINVTFVVNGTTITAQPPSISIGPILPSLQQAVSVLVNPAAEVAIGSSTSQGGAWLSASPATISAPASFSATIDARTLTPGTYQGNILLQQNGFSGSPFVPLNVPVTVIVGIAVPNVTGQTQAGATTAIQSANLTVGSVTFAPSNTVALGKVISQNPAATTVVTVGSSVSLVISSGPAPATVPNVVGLTQSSASSAIVAAGLTLGSVTISNSNSVPAGSVISQSPAAGTQANAGSPVNLVVSGGLGQVTVPNVAGLTQAAASNALQAAGLVTGTITTSPSNSVPAGSVISQSPLAGISVSGGSAVNLVISTGTDQVTVPNVAGATQSAAQNTILAAGLVVGSIDFASSPTIPSGNVISEAPPAGTQTSTGSIVNLVISSGPAQQSSGTIFALPQLAFGGGWYTALYFSNTTTSTTSIQVDFIAESGTPLSVPLRRNGSDVGSVTSQTVSLNPGETVILEALNRGDLTQGWVEATLPAGVNGYGVFRQSIAGRPDQEAVVPLTSETSQVVDFTYDDTGLTTAIAIVNPSNLQITVTATAYRNDGTLIGSSAIPLGPRTKQALVLRNLQGLIVGQRGWITFSADNGAVSVLGLRAWGEAFTSIPVTPRSGTSITSSTFALPQFAVGGGWYTALYFSNTTSSAATIGLNYIADFGVPSLVPLLMNGQDMGQVSGQTISLNPGQSVILELPNTGNLIQGWVEASLDPGVVGYAVYRQSVAGRADQEAVVPLEPESARSAELIYDNTDHVTALAILNPSNFQSTITITALGSDGSVAGSTQIALPPRWKQEWLLTDLPGLAGTAGKRGSINFSVSPGTVSVLGLRSGGSAFTSIPAVHQ